MRRRRTGLQTKPCGRGCEHFAEERDRDEMVRRRFPRFARTVWLVHRVNSCNLSYKLAINEYANA